MTVNVPSDGVQKELEEILNTKSFDKLEAFGYSDNWLGFSQTEKALLAELFILQAETSVKNGVTEDSFSTIKASIAKAFQLAGNSFELFMRKGKIFSHFHFTEALKEAYVAFEEALMLDQNSFSATFESVEILISWYLITKEHIHLDNAMHRLQIAERIQFDGQDKTSLTWLHWRLGFVHFLVYRASEEPHDLKQAIVSYKKAEEYGLSKEEFYNDLGNALVEFGALTGKMDMIFDAIDSYIKSVASQSGTAAEADVELRKEYAIRFFNLACCYTYLFEEYGLDSYYHLAKDNYDKSLACCADFSPCVYKGGCFYLYSAAIRQDSFLLDRSVQLLSKAAESPEASARCIGCFAEALIRSGSAYQNLNLFNQAGIAIEAGYKQHGKALPIVLAEAFLFYELGLYFTDSKYHILALTKLEELDLEDRKNSSYFYLFALLKSTLGEESHSEYILEEALKAFAVASKGELARNPWLWNDWGLALLAIAEISHSTKHVDEASDKFGRAILVQEHVHPEHLVNYGATLDLLGDLTDDDTYYERAVQVLQTCLTLDPTLPTVHFQLALACLHLAEVSDDEELFVKALDHFDYLIKDDPEDDAAWYEAGVIHTHFGLKDNKIGFEKADFCLKRAAQLGNSHAYYNLACINALSLNIDTAFQYLNEAIERQATPPLQELLSDDWLESIKADERFIGCIAKFKFLSIDEDDGQMPSQ